MATMDNIPLKVLFLEDALPDMEVTVEQLIEAGFRLDVTHVESESGFREALQEKTYDIILSDINLPGFDAFGALEISQELCPEVPFVCISGAVGEEAAVELMKKGAVDYVLKDRPGRLPFTLKRSLEEAKEKAALKQKSENLAKLLKASSDLNETIDKKALLQKIVDTAVELTEMDSGAIYMLEEGHIHLSATRPPLPDTYPDEFRRALLDDHWHIKRSVLKKEIVILHDAYKEELSEQEHIVIEASGFRTLIYLPLIHDNVVLGVLILGTTSRVHQISDEELSLCKTLSNLSTTALANAMLFDKNRQFVEKMKLLNRSVEASSVSIVITDAEGHINYVNPYFSQLTGYTYQDVLGENPRILNSGQQPQSFYESLWKTILSGKDWRGEIQNKKQNGELYWEKAIISPILNSKGGVTNFVAIKEDITDRKRMLEELIVAKEKAEEGDKLKTAFINNISHEIRTPLNGILGFGQLIAEREFSPEDRKMMLGMLRKSSERLMNTVSGYMDIALISSGAMQVHKEDFLLEPVFQEIIKKTEQLCAVGGLDLIADIPDVMDGLRINSDPEHLKKIMDILIDNALKFTHQGTITCGLKIETSKIAFFVRDTGIGIEEGHLKFIFEMFRQEDSSMTRGYEGSGLGLSIAKGLVALLGGEIRVVTEKGKGSEFLFVLPYEPLTTLQPADNENKVKKPKKEKPLVLVAEDDELNYLFLETVLDASGYSYMHAINGLEAVEYCRQNAHISIVLMDMKMPVMGGLEATRKIHEFRPELPIIATTAYAQSGDEHRFLKVGCNAYVSKPIIKEKLLSVIEMYVE